MTYCFLEKILWFSENNHSTTRGKAPSFRKLHAPHPYLATIWSRIVTDQGGRVLQTPHYAHLLLRFNLPFLSRISPSLVPPPFLSWLMNPLGQSSFLRPLKLEKWSQAFNRNGCEPDTISSAMKHSQLPILLLLLFRLLSCPPTTLSGPPTTYKRCNSFSSKFERIRFLRSPY